MLIGRIPCSTRKRFSSARNDQLLTTKDEDFYYLSQNIFCFKLIMQQTENVLLSGNKKVEKQGSKYD